MQMSLFPELQTEVKNGDIDAIKGLSEAERTWLKGLDKDDRPAGIAFCQWKRAVKRDFDKMSRPQIWMEGFLLAMDYVNAQKEEATAE